LLWPRMSLRSCGLPPIAGIYQLVGWIEPNVIRHETCGAIRSAIAPYKTAIELSGRHDQSARSADERSVIRRSRATNRRETRRTILPSCPPWPALSRASTPTFVAPRTPLAGTIPDKPGHDRTLNGGFFRLRCQIAA